MKKRYTIGVVIGNANSPHTKTLMRGIYDAAEKKDVNVIFFLGVHMANYYHAYFGDSMGNRFDYQHNVVYDYSRLSDVDGLIISYGSLCIFLEQADRQKFLSRFNGIPYVIVEDRDDSLKGSAIISDNYNGMYEIVDHLISVHNIKKLVMLGGPKSNTDAQEREQAFRAALKHHNITVTDDMIEAGDFSQCCERPINRLLDRYPDAQALVCANDVMAETAYYECAKRGLIVGKDIAITGYDNWDMAETMTPPLTTVYQNELDMGYKSVEQILALLEGEEPTEIITPADVKIRASCGCVSTTEFKFPSIKNYQIEKYDVYIEDVASSLCDNVLLTRVSDEVRAKVMDKIKNILSYGARIYLDFEHYYPNREDISNAINDFVAGELVTYISPTIFAEGLHAFSMHLVHESQKEFRNRALMELDGIVQLSIQSSVTKYRDAITVRYEQDTMFVPLVARDMMNEIHDEKAFFEASMTILSVLHTKSAFLYILERPKKHKYGQEWKCPDRMRLASCWNDGKVISYEPEDRPIVSMNRGCTAIHDFKERRVLTSFGLFLGEYQYGLLMVEIDPKDMMLMYLVSMQISSSLDYFHVYQKQMRLQNKLENLIEEVNEKNKILGFISEYDELTGLLNRRGFMERAMRLVHDKIYEKAILVIADLDHLKEINDCYGHVAGDFALQSAAEILKNAFEKDTLLARIGGDEFIAIMPYDSRMAGSVYARRIREAHENFNERSDKEFYVEISAGYAEFECNSDINMEEIMARADEYLYEAKKIRRTSVKRLPKN